jgi:hypothetical protein
MAVIYVEDQNARRIGSALLLGPIGHAEVKIPFRLGLGGRRSGGGRGMTESFTRPIYSIGGA